MIFLSFFLSLVFGCVLISKKVSSAFFLLVFLECGKIGFLRPLGLNS